MIDFDFDFVFLTERADYRVISTRGRLPFVFYGLDARKKQNERRRMFCLRRSPVDHRYKMSVGRTTA
jgi:hypothetical protein